MSLQLMQICDQNLIFPGYYTQCVEEIHAKDY